MPVTQPSMCADVHPLTEARPIWDRNGAGRRGPSAKTAQRLCDTAALATAAAFAVPFDN